MTDTFHAQLIQSLPSMKAFAMTLCRNRTRADDLVQDAACRSLAKSDLFEPGSNFKAWVFTIMRNQYIDAVRSDNKKGTVDVSDEVFESLRVTLPNQEHSLVLKDLIIAMDHLTNDQREVLNLVVVNGLSYDEAASVCKCPVGTIRSRLARARRDLEALMLGEAKLGQPKRERRSSQTHVMFS